MHGCWNHIYSYEVHDSVLVGAAKGDQMLTNQNIPCLLSNITKFRNMLWCEFTIQLLTNIVYFIICWYNFCDYVTWDLAKTPVLMFRLRTFKRDSTVLLIGWLQSLYSSFGRYIHRLDSNYSEDTGWSVVYLHSVNWCIPGSSYCSHLLSCSNMATCEWKGTDVCR